MIERTEMLSDDEARSWLRNVHSDLTSPERRQIRRAYIAQQGTIVEMISDVVKKFRELKKLKEEGDAPPSARFSDCMGASLTVDDFNRAKEALVKAKVPQTNCVAVMPASCGDVYVSSGTGGWTPMYYNEPLSLDPLAMPRDPGHTHPIDYKWINGEWVSQYEQKQEEKETTMCYPAKTSAVASNVTINAAEQPSDLSNARDHLRARVSSIYCKHDAALRTEFKMSAPSPSTLADAIEWLKAGKIELSDGYSMDQMFSEWDSFRGAGIRFVDPDYKADKAGYKTAEKKLDAARDEAIDTIMVLDEAKGLEALKAFQSATFH